jgi:hypothetical protein
MHFVKLRVKEALQQSPINTAIAALRHIDKVDFACQFRPLPPAHGTDGHLVPILNYASGIRTPLKSFM